MITLQLAVFKKRRKCQGMVALLMNDELIKCNAPTYVRYGNTPRCPPCVAASLRNLENERKKPKAKKRSK